MKSIKKLVLTGKMSARSRNAIEKGRSTRTGDTIIGGIKLGTITDGKHSASIETSVGAMVVIKPRKFFYITDAQRATFEEVFMRDFFALIDQAGGAA